MKKSLSANQYATTLTMLFLLVGRTLNASSADTLTFAPNNPHDEAPDQGRPGLSLTQAIAKRDQSVFKYRDLSILNFSKEDITNLEGTEKIPTSVSQLDLGGNRISMLRPLQVLTNLTRLNLYDNQLTNCEGLQHLARLTWLSLGKNKLAGQLSFAELPASLKILSLAFNKVTGCRKLGHLNNLDELYLHSNPLANLENLEQMPEKSCIFLNGGIDVTQQLGGRDTFVHSFEYIEGSGGKWRRLNPLPSSSVCTIAQADSPKGSTLLPSQELHSSDDPTSPAPVQLAVYEKTQTPNAFELGYRTGRGYERQTVSFKDRNSAFLSLYGKDIYSLQNCVIPNFIYSLALDYNELEDFGGLPELPNLGFLSATNNKIKSLQGLVSLQNSPKLRSINLSKNAELDISSFPDGVGRGLKFLYLDNTGLKDIPQNVEQILPGLILLSIEQNPRLSAQVIYDLRSRFGDRIRPLNS